MIYADIQPTRFCRFFWAKVDSTPKEIHEISYKTRSCARKCISFSSKPNNSTTMAFKVSKNTVKGWVLFNSFCLISVRYLCCQFGFGECRKPAQSASSRLLSARADRVLFPSDSLQINQLHLPKPPQSCSYLCSCSSYCS